MLYIEDADDGLWLSIVELLGERQICEMVLCLYPDSEEDGFPEPFTTSHDPEPLERVTAYPDGREPPCSARLPVSASTLDVLRLAVGEFEDWGDSLLVYPPRERQWIAAFIPQRRVVLVQDVRLEDFLDAAGIEASTEAPPGWKA